MIRTAAVLFLLAGCATPAPAGRATVDLNGEWEFRLDPEDRGKTDKWFEAGVPFDRRIRVPGAWNAQGVAYESEAALRDYEQKKLNGTNLLGVDRESDKLFSVFPGPAWYRRSVQVPAGWTGKTPWLVFGGAHRSADVWVNGQHAISHGSYLTPFRVDLSRWARPGETVTVAVRVDARRNKAVDPLLGCLDTLDFLYVSWGGLYRPVTLEATAPRRLEQVFAVPDPAASTVTVRLEPPFEASVEIVDAAGRTVVRGGPNLPLAIADARLWSPREPYLYTARVTSAEGDVLSARFGMREFKVAGQRFLLNGKPIFLRGYGDDCLFPNTVAPPVGKAEYLRRLSLARDYGFNYVRHHSWMPPPEYLDAADELGMMIQPEFPIAYRWDLAQTAEAKRVYFEEWREMIRLHRNHPSIVAWCMGNEQYDSFPEAPEMYRIAKETDPTRVVIDSDGCGWKHKDRATLDFLVVQFNEGGSIGFGDPKYSVPADAPKPVVCHEMGYFVTLHDLEQQQLFKTGIKPYWLAATRELAAKQGVAADYPAWLEASYRLQSVCLKTNIEAARRSRLSGISVWLFQDYPNCAEGIVDMFWRPKGVTADEFRRFNAPAVLLLDSPRRVFTSGLTVELPLLVSRFELPEAERAELRWTFNGEEGRREVALTSDGVQALATVSVRMPDSKEARKLSFRASLEGAENDWDLWVFPPPASVKPENVVVTPKLDVDLIDRLEKGGRVFLTAAESVFPTEATNFRLASWDGGGPSGTVIDRAHPALRGVPNDGWCDLSFYSMIQGSKPAFLDPLPAKVRPIIRCIDRPQRLANRAYLFEAAVGKGKLLVSGFAWKTTDAASAHLFHQLLAYAAGPEFAPSAELSADWLRARLKK